MLDLFYEYPDREVFIFVFVGIEIEGLIEITVRYVNANVVIIIKNPIRKVFNKSSVKRLSLEISCCKYHSV